MERKWAVPTHKQSKNIRSNKIDVMLISETHLTEKHYFKIPSYTIYHTTQIVQHMEVLLLLLKTTYDIMS